MTKKTNARTVQNNIMVGLAATLAVAVSLAALAEAGALDAAKSLLSAAMGFPSSDVNGPYANSSAAGMRARW